VLVPALWHASFNLVTATQAGRVAGAAAVSVRAMVFGYVLAADLRARRKGTRAVLA